VARAGGDAGVGQQVAGQWLVDRFGLVFRQRDHSGRDRLLRSADILFQIVEPKFQLLDLPIQLLRGAAELEPAQPAQPSFQLLDLQRLGDQAGSGLLEFRSRGCQHLCRHCHMSGMARSAEVG